MAATATGSGRSAPGPTTSTTTAPMTAAGGTLTPSPSMTGATTGGSAATSSTPGGGARRMGQMTVLTGHATATGTGRTALASTGNPTTAPMTAAGGSPQVRTMTGPMTGGSPATSSPHGRRATRPSRSATTTGSGMSAGKHGGEASATSRTGANSAGCTGATNGSMNTLSPATSGGAPSASEHWISQGLRQQIFKWLRSHAISPVHAGETASLLTSSKC